MEENSGMSGRVTRREFLGSMAAMAALSVVPGSIFARQTGGLRSNFGGVHIGTITYSYRSMPDQSAEAILGYVVDSGLSSIELMGGPAEEFAGAPTMERPNFQRGQQITQAQRQQMQAARQEYAKELSKWRQSVSMKKYQQLRKMYNDAGVHIYIIKFSDLNENMSEGEIDYCFNVAKTLGAKGITTELSVEKAKVLGPYADKHNLMIAFHNHTQVNPNSWEEPLSYGRYLGMNFDIGHYVAGTNLSDIPIIERYDDDERILSLHIKDRKVNNGPNMPFGQGDTPLSLTLLHLKQTQSKIQPHIELEYEVPEGSDAVTEVRKCVEFCKEVLTA